MADSRSPNQQDRAERLAAALRDNLKKRKARARGTGTVATPVATPDDA